MAWLKGASINKTSALSTEKRKQKRYKQLTNCLEDFCILEHPYK